MSGLVVQTSTSLGLLFPSVFDAMSCGENMQRRQLQLKENVHRCHKTDCGEGNMIKTQSNWTGIAGSILNISIHYSLLHHPRFLRMLPPSLHHLSTTSIITPFISTRFASRTSNQTHPEDTGASFCSRGDKRDAFCFILTAFSESCVLAS